MFITIRLIMIFISCCSVQNFIITKPQDNVEHLNSVDRTEHKETIENADHTKSFNNNIESKDSLKKIESTSAFWQQIAPLLVQVPATDQELSIAQRSLMLTSNALFKHGSQAPAINPELLQTLNSLHIFSHILPKIAKTNLYHGYALLAKQICSISDNQEKLTNKRNYIHYLVQHPELCTQLNELLIKIKPAEDVILPHFFPKYDDPDLEKFLNESLLGKFIKKLTNIEEITNELLSKNNLLREFFIRTSQVTNLYFLWRTSCEAYQKISQENYGNQNIIGKFISSGKSLITAGWPTIKILTLITVLKAEFNSVYKEYIDLTHLHQLEKCIKEINVLLKKHPTLTNEIPDLASHINDLANTKASSQVSSQLASFLKTIKSSSFTTASYYISRQGLITNTHIEYKKIINQLIPVFETLGSLDAQLSVVKLVQEKDSAYCYPTWITSAKPVLIINDYWHPMLNPLTTIKNSMTIDGRSGPLNVIITGANAGGKTTALTAIMIAQIFAQSIGIAPAKSLTCTPFTNLLTYLDISTNLAQGESLFMAQANRAEKLFKTISTCPLDKKSLSILDEIFTGTRADFAQDASYKFADTLGRFPNSICLLATHFPKMTELEKLKTFMNYCVADATISPLGDIIYPYKIIPGISTQNIAKTILEKKGLLQSYPNHTF